MSTPTRLTFVVWAPDATDPDAFQRRLAVRAEHLAVAHKNYEAGITKVGGAMVTPETQTAEQKKMIGSVLIIEAENLEAARKFVESDVYYTNNVWDKEKLVISPIVLAHPL